ncbi:FAD/NAD(P)-binding domain-containing protein [Mollisia scopiformis]|uniref:FAD/NAD(P)-binding domain-containing protein n=1 Tax=Mollisia scopiformis TaxID=149040 RepID=A0A194XE03_MOLSC|nr:FAD/NAD(P)-binding domain-containing protein [Mollisia scopiformis]KUJ18415.1 FAD/NAD(P)-binding domain-containing protein [Mollisia scopiformis]
MTTKTGIIGGGVSGLRCADVLLQQGFQVTILEARDRLGGRMHQDTLPNGHIVDMGPNWIHGTDNNPILDLAKMTKTATHSWADEADALYDDQGKRVSNASELSGTFWGIIMEAFKFSEHHGATIDPSRSLWDFFLEKASLMSKNDEEKRKANMLLQIAEMWGAFIGTPISRQSLKFFWLEECIDGENLFCAGTYQNILAVITKHAKEQAIIHLNTKVNRIETENGQPILHTTNGGSFEFDEVVVTAPLGWLKKNKSVFNPELPSRLTEAIDAIGYGNLEKVYVTFPRAFWQGPSDEPNKEPPAGFIQWLHPAYSKPPASKDWNQEAVDLATLPGASAHPTLLFYIFGDQGSLIAKKWNDLHTESQRTTWLADYFQPYISKLPHYDAASKDCIPSYCLATSWTTDDLAGNGSYSNFPVGLKEGDKDIEIMREGLPDRNLWFAGEHTAPFVALGTVTGAYWSGEMVAQRIARKYGKECEVLDSQNVGGSSTGHDGGKDVNVRGFADDGLKTA